MNVSNTLFFWILWASPTKSQKKDCIWYILQLCSLLPAVKIMKAKGLHYFQPQTLIWSPAGFKLAKKSKIKKSYAFLNFFSRFNEFWGPSALKFIKSWVIYLWSELFILGARAAWVLERPRQRGLPTLRAAAEQQLRRWTAWEMRWMPCNGKGNRRISY